jgi:hypothetical protein
MWSVLAPVRSRLSRPDHIIDAPFLDFESRGESSQERQFTVAFDKSLSQCVGAIRVAAAERTGSTGLLHGRHVAVAALLPKACRVGAVPDVRGASEP